MNTEIQNTRSYWWGALACCVIFFLFFQPRWAFTVNIIDETCYLEALHKILGINYPACYLKTHLPGVAIIWLPAAVISKTLTVISSFSFEQWLLPLIGIGAFGLWSLTLFLIFKLLQATPSIFTPIRNNPWWLSLLFLLNIPVLDFATRHTLMPHIAELSIAFLILLAVEKNKMLVALFMAIFLTLIRLNDIPVILVIIGAMWEKNKFKVDKIHVLMGILSIVLTLGVAVWIGLVSGHANVRITDILRSISIKAFKQVLFSPVESLFLYIPLWMASLALGLFNFKKLSLSSRAGVLWMMSLFFFNVGHRGNWTFDGPHFRFFIGSYAAVFLIIRDLWTSLNSWQKYLLKFSAIFGACWYTLMVWTGANPHYWAALIQGTEIGKSYIAFDGSTMPAYLRKFLIEPFGLSPIGFTFYSWLHRSTLFSTYSQFEPYACKGPALGVLSATVIIGLVIMVITFKKLSPSKMRADPPSDGGNKG